MNHFSKQFFDLMHRFFMSKLPVRDKCFLSVVFYRHLKKYADPQADLPEDVLKVIRQAHQVVDENEAREKMT
ncbi:MAG TPA: hypothetical protein PLZ86_06915 [bacterium]|nr:hypothetical protein [bacterium]